MITIHEAAARLREQDNFLILTHARPDGDALGSGAGLCQGLRELGKTAYLLKNPEMGKNYASYITPYEAPGDFVPGYLLSVDTASTGILQVNAAAYADQIRLAIDHHVSNTGYAEESCVYPERAACGEIIYTLLMEMAGKLSPETATLLYLAVSTDTGCFVYGNTNAETLETAAALVRAGAPNGKLNKLFFRTKSKSRIVLEGEILKNLEFYGQDRVAFSVITLAMMAEAGACEEDTDDVAAIPGQIAGVKIGVTIREIKDGCKISVRTTPDISANEICAQLGGGGHAMASGASLTCGVQAAKEEVLTAIKTVCGASYGK